MQDRRGLSSLGSWHLVFWTEQSCPNDALITSVPSSPSLSILHLILSRAYNCSIGSANMSSRVSMLSLPFEILWAIFDGIALVDLRSIRLVCSSLSNVASPRLFASLRLRTEVNSGLKLLAVSRSDSLRPFVRELEMYVFSIPC